MSASPVSASPLASLTALEELVSRDPANRHIASLVQPGHLAGAARALLEAKHVLITTGFFVPAVNAGETDGPPGARSLGAALTRLGIAVTYVTDSFNAPYLEALGAAPLHLYEAHLLHRLRPTHLISVERLGRAADGAYYNMRGEDMTAHTAPVDEYFIAAGEQGIVTIGIGDGGNEIGMGRCLEAVRTNIPHGPKIACTVPTDFLIAAGVSNWGAYGLTGAISALSGECLLPTAEEMREHVETLVRMGSVDGVTRRNTLTVDGQDLDAGEALLSEMRALLESAKATAG